MGYTLIFTPHAVKDKQKLEQSNLHKKAIEILSILKRNPYQTPPSYEKLTGNLSGKYSRRISLQHRLVYEVDEKQKIVKIIRMWTHYE
ncbi:MAG: Txe/YoeB family addiction module toxin [Thermoguttaceae bacterium]